MRIVIRIFIFILLLIGACSPNETKTEEQNVTKNDSVKPASPPVQMVEEVKPKYSGSYNIIVTRFEDYHIDQTLELEQIGDSVKGIYKRDFFVKGSDPFASFVADVWGSVRKNELGAESILFDVKIKSSEIDTVKLKQHSWAEKMVGEFVDGPALYVRFSETNNSIENNYAGGAWDTWTRIK